MGVSFVLHLQMHVYCPVLPATPSKNKSRQMYAMINANRIIITETMKVEMSFLYNRYNTTTKDHLSLSSTTIDTTQFSSQNVPVFYRSGTVKIAKVTCALVPLEQDGTVKIDQETRPPLRVSRWSVL